MFLNKLLILIIIIIILLLLIIYIINKDEVYYIKNILSEEDYEYVKNYTKSIKNLKYEKFRHVKPIYDKRINDIFYSNKMIDKINKIINNKIIKSDFPIEYRIYPEGSKGMYCHKDTQLYNKPQYEVVFTINNESDSYTNWYSYLGFNNKIYTDSNSIIIVKAQENTHCVSPINKGYRSILKLIYTQTSDYNNNYLKEIQRFK